MHKFSGKRQASNDNTWKALLNRQARARRLPI